MYTLIRQGLPAWRPRQGGASGARSRVAGVVILMGATSLLTDVSSEMVASVLPLYLVLQLQLSPLYFGFIDGIYQLASVPLRLAGGMLGDRLRRHKEVASFGYALSAGCKLGLASASSVWPGLTGFLLVDRAGKGIRTAPRDAIIAASTAPQSLGLAFGVHRAMDTFGAVLGPVLAFVILSIAPDAYRTIFMVSFCFAAVGVAIIVLFVNGSSVEAIESAPTPAPRVRAGEVVGLVVRHRFARLLVAATALGLCTVSDGLLYLVLQRQLDFEVGLFPLLYVATAGVYFMLAIPFGWLADRVGRGRVLILGYVLLAGTYTALLREPGGIAQITVYLVMFGAYYAATDGVLTAMASERLPDHLRGTGLAMMASATGVARFGGAVLFGGAWALWGSGAALALVVGGLLVAIVVAVPLVAERRIVDTTE